MTEVANSVSFLLSRYSSFFIFHFYYNSNLKLKGKCSLLKYTLGTF